MHSHPFTTEQAVAHNKARAKPFDEWWMPEPNSGCWLWLGAIWGGGYGCASDGNGGRMSAHRRSWQMHHGEVPDGLHVLHRCDVRCCVNPDHLFLGTDQDNMDDMIRKGRDRKNPLRGEAHHAAQATMEIVREIRSRAIYRGAFIDWGNEFGLSQKTVRKIARHITWRHI